MPSDLDPKLLASIQTAPIVVVGHVREVRPLESTVTGERAAPLRITEHDPALAEAVIDVDEQIKGSPPGQQVVVRFPTSTDVMWYRYPKLEAGHSGVFILQQDVFAPKTTAVTDSATRTFNLARKGDVLPLSDAARVRAVVKRTTTGE